MRGSPASCAVVALALLWLGGCAQHAQVSQAMLTLSPESMAMRQLQTKRYDTSDEKLVLTASASVLQDLGFQLDESTPDLGILVGSKKRDATDPGQVALAIVIAALGGGAIPVDHQQTIRVSLVTAPMARARDPEPAAAPKGGPPTDEQIAALCARVSARLQQSLADELTRVLPAAEAKAAGKQFADKAAKTLNEDLALRVKMLAYSATRVRVTFQRVVINTRGQVTRMEALETPELYQEFFEKLSKSVFLEANDI